MEHKKIISKIFITVFWLCTGTKILPAAEILSYSLSVICYLVPNGLHFKTESPIITYLKDTYSEEFHLHVTPKELIEIKKTGAIHTALYFENLDKVDLIEINSEIASKNAWHKHKLLKKTIKKKYGIPTDKLECYSTFNLKKKNGEIIEEPIPLKKTDYKPEKYKVRLNKNNNRKRNNFKNPKKRQPRHRKNR